MIIIHIPHSSLTIPDKYRSQFILNDEQLNFEARIMADLFTDDLAKKFKEEKIIFPVSRLVCDIERFRNDEDEEMSKIGMGVVYAKTHNLKPLRKDGVDVEKIKKNLYDKHHILFEKKVREMLNKNGTCFIIDLHSYAEKALPYELHKDDKRPDICLGFNNYHMDKNIIFAIKKICVKAGYSVLENQPFKGSIVPSSFYKKDKRVKSLMIEINKRIYLKSFNKNKDGFTKLQVLLKKILIEIKKY